MPCVRAAIHLATLVLALAVAAPAAGQLASAARTGFERLLDRERALTTGAEPPPSPAQVRALVADYLHFSGRFAWTGYADNALWQAARLAGGLSTETRSPADRATATRLLRHLIEGYPASSLIPEAKMALRDLLAAPQPSATAAPKPPAARPVELASELEPARAESVAPPGSTSPSDPVAGDTPATSPAGTPTGPESELAWLTDIRRTVLPDLVRVTLELTREVEYYDERLAGPARVYVDLREASTDQTRLDSVLSYPDDAIRHVRIGSRPRDTIRVVLDLHEVERYSVFALYNPFRLVVDVYRTSGVRTDIPPSPLALAAPRSAGADATAIVPATPVPTTLPPPVPTAPPLPVPAAPVPPAPEPPAANTSGSFSISRQLGLNVSRIVIDPGHGGHDPGAMGKRISEAALVLDVALRVEKLLLGNPTFDVVLTRRTDVFVELEERTAIANRANADLFLSIHANASRNTKARGVETYVLNFASNPMDAEVAARENAASGRSMHQLGDIVRAIALNNKLDESLEFAGIVQDALIGRLRGTDAGIRDLGVKQAPFAVLIGAGMPSVLAEISFVTNPRDAQLLGMEGHRQRIAESLYQAIQSYQRTLKAAETVASQ